MATKSFLGQETFETLKAKYLNSAYLENFETQAQSLCLEISSSLSKELTEAFNRTPGFHGAKPVATGSWAREELCCKSDIDLLLLGDTSSTRQFMAALQECGIKVRSRVPENPNDWTLGVELSDILSYLHAKPLFNDGGMVKRQAQKIVEVQNWKKKVVQFIKKESGERAHRYSSISNYLEPNLKFGPGGLRDCLQALQVVELYSDKFAAGEVQEQLQGNKYRLLLIRHLQHFSGGGDILTSPLQHDLYTLFGFSNVQNFMRLVEKTLFEVRFLMDYVLEASQSSAARQKKLQQIPLGTIPQALEALSADPSLLLVYRVREERKGFKAISKKALGKSLRKYLNWNASEKHLFAIYRSGLLESLLPEFNNVKGLVQHDQYHRYTVDAHLFIAMKEALSFNKAPGEIGELGLRGDKEFSSLDRETLFYSALFHDIGKGSKGDHSVVGGKLAQEYLSEWGFPNYLVENVSWIVENHLLMSQAAFRRNPESPQTWQDLWSQGVKKKRVLLLGVFTAIDIRATNPDAWNSWKQSLLIRLVDHLESSVARKLLRLISNASLTPFKWKNELFSQMDMELVKQLPEVHLIRDFKKISKSKKLPALVIAAKPGYWVRFQNPKDKKGLFLAYTQLLHGMGCSIQEAYIETLPKIGVYDWFKIRSNKSLATLRKQIKLLEAKDPPINSVTFDSIEITGRDEKGIYIAFRGKDVRGALVCAAKSLSDHGLIIKWARVHTWGQQLDDIFCVEEDDQVQNKVLKIKECLVKKVSS